MNGKEALYTLQKPAAFLTHFKTDHLIFKLSLHFLGYNSCEVHMFSNNENISVSAVNGDRSLQEFKQFLNIDDNGTSENVLSAESDKKFSHVCYHNCQKKKKTLYAVNVC